MVTKFELKFRAEKKNNGAKSHLNNLNLTKNVIKKIVKQPCASLVVFLVADSSSRRICGYYLVTGLVVKFSCLLEG